MTRHRVSRAGLLAGAVAAVAGCGGGGGGAGSAGGRAAYIATDLGTLGGEESLSLKISDAGHVVGVSQVANGAWHPFIWFQRRITDLYRSEQAWSSGYGDYAMDVNSQGQVILSFQEIFGFGGGGPNRGGATWHTGKYEVLGKTLPLALNARGDLVALDQNGIEWRYFLQRDGSRTLFPAPFPPEPSFLPSLIDNSAQVAGILATYQSPGTAALWANGRVTNLGTLGGIASQPLAMNNTGEIVGQADLLSGKRHAFSWLRGVLRDLGTLEGGDTSRADAVNDRGQIVGTSSGSAALCTAVLWQGDRIQDLSVLRFRIEGDTTGAEATRFSFGGVIPLSWGDCKSGDINALGQIAGQATVNGHRHAVILTPQ